APTWTRSAASTIATTSSPAPGAWARSSTTPGCSLPVGSGSDGGTGHDGGRPGPAGSRALHTPLPAAPARPGRLVREAPSFIARWDLDKTYLRTDFDTVRDLVRTAIERPDQKRTVPGAATLMRELGRAGAEIHILSGSPEQLRSCLAAKLRLDGVRWASLTLKPNLENILRLRFKALRGQLGYKLPSLLRRRAELPRQRRPATMAEQGGALIPEVLLGDDAEADAFVYSLYADVCAGTVTDLAEVMRLGGCYDDTIADSVRFASYVEKGPVVARILIHLDRQSSASSARGWCRSTTTSRRPSCCTRTASSRRRACSASRRTSPSSTTSTAARSRGATSTCRGAGT